MNGLANTPEEMQQCIRQLAQNDEMMASLAAGNPMMLQVLQHPGMANALSQVIQNPSGLNATQIQRLSNLTFAIMPQRATSPNHAPDPDIYPAIFAMVDADRNEGIAVYDNLIMHFPDWFLALSEKERARYQHHCFHWFNLFMARFETIKDKESANLPKIKDASTKFLALSRHLLSFYLRSNPRVGV